MKKYLLFICLIVIASLESFGQSDSIRVQKYSKSGKVVVEEYFIRADSTKNGPYRRFNEKGKRLMEGQYRSGKPVGVWVYYEDNNWNRPYSKFDWDTLQELEYHYVSNRMGKNASDSFCRFPGGEMVWHHYSVEICSKIAKENPDNKGKAKIRFQLDPTGKAILKEIEWFDTEGKKQPINPNLEAELRSFIENMPSWIYCSEANTHFVMILPIEFN